MNSILNKSWNNGNLIKYFVVVLRWYIAFYMFTYGYSKMTGGQFQIHDANILKQPLETVDSFYVAWHLFGRSSFFNISVGLTQCLGAILIVINRTKLLGALILLPVIINIFIIDVSFTTSMFGFSLAVRLFIMILCDLFILYHYRAQMIATFKILTVKLESDLVPKWWVYPIFLILGFLMDIVFALLSSPIKYLLKYVFHLDIF
jgi:uncharacterized membrane protein YphA (DoxX/SURF4 family)